MQGESDFNVKEEQLAPVSILAQLTDGFLKY
jgi:hypothetical protein